jgi:hypothetical protein
MTNENSVGMPATLATSSAAPVSERFRTVQSMAAPVNAIVPTFNTRCLGVVRLFVIVFNFWQHG